MCEYIVAYVGNNGNDKLVLLRRVYLLIFFSLNIVRTGVYEINAIRVKKTYYYRNQTNYLGGISYGKHL